MFPGAAAGQKACGQVTPDASIKEHAVSVRLPIRTLPGQHPTGAFWNELTHDFLGAWGSVPMAVHMPFPPKVIGLRQSSETFKPVFLTICTSCFNDLF